MPTIYNNHPACISYDRAQRAMSRKGNF